MIKKIYDDKDILLNLLKYENENKSPRKLIDLMTKKNTLNNLLSLDDENEIRKILF